MSEPVFTAHDGKVFYRGTYRGSTSAVTERTLSAAYARPGSSRHRE